MNDELDRDKSESQRQNALARLGTDQPCCVACGEGDWRCLELHHIAGRAYDETTVVLCRNCHRKQSEPSQNKKAPAVAPLMATVGHWLAGLMAFLQALVHKGKAFAGALLEGAKVCPWPYGWIGAPGVVQ